MLFRRSAVESVGGFEDAFRDQYDDMVLNQKILLRYPALVADGCSAWYRQHPHNSCAVALRTGFLSYDGPSPARGEYLFWLQRHLTSEGLVDTEVWGTLQEQLWPYRHPHLFRLSKRARQVKKVTRSVARRMLPPFVRDRLRARGKRPVKARNATHPKSKWSDSTRPEPGDAKGRHSPVPSHCGR